MKKWNLGSNKLVRLGSEEYKKLQELATELNARMEVCERTAKTYFRIQECYEDYGADMMWTTLICYYYSHLFGYSHFQAITPAEWLGLANDDITVSNLADSLFEKYKTL